VTINQLKLDLNAILKVVWVLIRALIYNYRTKITNNCIIQNDADQNSLFVLNYNISDRSYRWKDTYRFTNQACSRISIDYDVQLIKIKPNRSRSADWVRNEAWCGISYDYGCELNKICLGRYVGVDSHKKKLDVVNFVTTWWLWIVVI
jgi:hypothetical protein